MTDTTAGPSPSNPGLWEDFIDILYQPSDVFDRRREGQFGLVLVVLIVMWAVLYFALQNGIGPIMDVEMSRQAAAMAQQNPAMTADQLASAKSAMEKFALFGAVIFVPVGILITGCLLWLAGRVIEAKVAFAAAMMIATYSQIPRIIELVLNAVQGLFLPPEAITSRYSVTLGLGRFMDPDSNPVLMTVLGGIDLFTIWTLVLMAIGLSVVARVSIQKGAIAAGLVWIVSLLPALFGALAQG